MGFLLLGACCGVADCAVRMLLHPAHPSAVGLQMLNQPEILKKPHDFLLADEPAPVNVILVEGPPDLQLEILRLLDHILIALLRRRAAAREAGHAHAFWAIGGTYRLANTGIACVEWDARRAEESENAKTQKIGQ